MVKCRQAYGSLYVGASPPPSCAPIHSGSHREKPPASVPIPSTGAPSPERRTKHGDVERHRHAAVAFQTIHNRLDGDHAFIEGTVANGATFAVYNVRVCIEGVCNYTAPSTLQPGSRATFQIPADREYYVRRGPDWRITWEFWPER